MNEREIRAAVLRALRDIAPEANPDALDDTATLREALDLDSMDFLHLITALHAALRVDVPEADYAKVQTMKGMVAYLASKLPDS